jgi:hypothetical protein
VVLGGTAQFNVAASGLPSPTFQWYFKGEVIPGADTATLQRPNVDWDDEGLYHVRASNSEGHADSVPVWLLATVPPAADGYDAWALQLPAGQRGKAYVFGGVPNLLRYALGGDASTPASALRLQAQPNASGMNLSFPRIDDSRLTYEIWGTNDLIHWGTEPLWIGLGSGPTSVDIQTQEPIWFLHLRVRWAAGD